VVGDRVGQVIIEVGPDGPSVRYEPIRGAAYGAVEIRAFA